MKEYYIWFLNKFNFPDAAVRDLIVFYEQIQADEECYNELMGIVDRYRQDINTDVLQMINDVKSLSWTNAVHPFTRALIMLILMSKYLKGRYEEKGLPLDVWENSMKDLLYKCIECRLVYGIKQCTVLSGLWDMGSICGLVRGILSSDAICAWQVAVRRFKLTDRLRRE